MYCDSKAFWFTTHSTEPFHYLPASAAPHRLFPFNAEVIENKLTIDLISCSLSDINRSIKKLDEMNRQPQPATEKPPVSRSGRFAEYWLKPLSLMALRFPEVHTMHNQTSGSPCPPTSKNPRRLYRPYKYGRIASNASHSLPTVRSNSHAAADVTQLDRIHETLAHSYRKSYPHLSHRAKKTTGRRTPIWRPPSKSETLTT